MKATTLKKKYPEMWEAIYDRVLQDMKIAAATVAHNAAFEATLEYHRQSKKG